MDLSIVIPLFNERDNVRRLYKGISGSLEPTSREFEIIFVDDGSDDGTLSILRSLAEADPRVRVIRLKDNYGQTAAMRAGIDHAEGSIIVTMDGDLQNDPRDIPRLVEKLEQGYDLVVGWRRDRKDSLLVRKIPSRIANWIIARMSGVPIHDTGCSLKAYRAQLIRQLPLYSDMHRFIPAMSTMATVRFAEVVVTHHRRRHGKSKYGLSRVGRVMLDIMTVKMLLSSSRRPLHWFGLWAFGSFVLAAATGLIWVYVDLMAEERPSFVFLVVSFLFTYLAAHLLIAGLFGELVIRTEPTQRVQPLAACHVIEPSSGQ